MSKKINQLDAATSGEIADNNNLFVLAIASTGLAKKVTRTQMKTAFGVIKTQYKGLGTENVTLTIPALSNREILMITRESGPIYEAETDTPNSAEYVFDGTDIEFGAAINLNERIVILHTAP